MYLLLCAHTSNINASNTQECILDILRVYLIYPLGYNFPRQVQVLQLANSLWSCRGKLKRKTTLILSPKYFRVNPDWGDSWCVSVHGVTQHLNWCLHQCILHSLLPQGIFPGLQGAPQCRAAGQDWHQLLGCVGCSTALMRRMHVLQKWHSAKHAGKRSCAFKERSSHFLKFKIYIWKKNNKC